MKKILSGFMALLAIGLIFYGCSATAAYKKTEKAVAVEATGTALWDYLAKQEYTKNWQMWPGKTAFYKGTEPHGVLLTTYVNDVAYEAVKGKKGVLPDRAIVAKENYSPDKKYMALTVMYKVKGYNPEAGDWFWAKYTPDGKIEAEGKAPMCISCHGTKKGNDYIMTSPLK